MLVIRPGDPVTYTSGFKQWVEVHASEFAFKDTYLLEIDNEKGKATAYCYKRNERDSFYMIYEDEEFASPYKTDKNVNTGEIAKADPKTFDMKIGLKVLNGG